MADDGEWHTVTNSKHTATPAPSQPSKARRKSRHRIVTPKQPVKQQQPSIQKETSKKTTSNPFHAVEDDDSDDEEEDGQVDPIDLPVPPYHTTILVSCPLADCESPIPFLDTTSLVKHLKDEHKLLFKNLHHMYMALDSYLNRWAKELEGKSVSDFGQLDTEEKDSKFFFYAKKKPLLTRKKKCM